MLKKDNRERVMEVFFDDPMAEFQLRELSRIVKFGTKSVKKYLSELIKINILKTKQHKVQKSPLYLANRDNEYFLFLKKLNNLRNLYESELIDFIKHSCTPNSIILFGSSSLGEDIKGSDIDIFVESDKKNLELQKYEKILKRKINIFFEKNIPNLSKELRLNIINGIKLYGFIEVK